MLRLRKFIWVKTNWVFSLLLLCMLSSSVSQASTDLSSKEQQQATQLKAILEQQNALIRDPLVKETLEQIIHRLHLALPNKIPETDILLIDDLEINAFAGPMGIMGINTGLLLACANADEFAGVMAHELAHHSQQHLLRSQQYQDQSRLPQVASILGAMALSAIDPQLGMGAMSVGATLSLKQQLSFSRDMEMEADRIGMHVLKKAGFDPNGLTSFFGKLSTQEQLNHSKLSSYLRTHLHTYQRLAETVDFSKNENSAPIRTRGPLHQDFLYALERTRVLHALRAHPSSFYTRLPEPQTPMLKQAWHYGYAYALSQDGQIAQAWQHVKPLIDKEHSVYPWLLAAELAEKEGHPEQALHYLADAWQQQPNNQAVFWNYLQALQLHRQYATAEKLLHTEQLQHAPLTEDYVVLATQIYVANQHPAHAYYLRARYAKQLGQPIMAKRYLQTALEQDNLDQSLRARLHIELDKIKLIEK